MAFRKIIILFCAALCLYSCNSNSHSNREADSSEMMDSSIMKKTDTLDGGLDTSVIDTSDTGK
ncbi:MAG TPA: hypothetical protein VGD22_17515 [Sphingobacteriaceae bacterium]